MFKNIKQIIAGILTASLLVALPSVSQEISDKIIKQEVSESYNKQIECLAKNIYYEAGSEPYEGKLAVAQVTMNRVNSGKFPSDICSVVYQKTVDQNLRTVCQFSWTCMVKELVVRDKYMWEESHMIAKRALTEPYVHDKIAESKALYFHATYIKPDWNRNKVVKQIGNHIFYTKI
jgi:spore germination cell wall hydrolase CwlJ-like protein